VGWHKSTIDAWLVGSNTRLGREFQKYHIAFNVPLAELLAVGERLNAGIKTRTLLAWKRLSGQ
jgi:hypothetical protein